MDGLQREPKWRLARRGYGRPHELCQRKGRLYLQFWGRAVTFDPPQVLHCIIHLIHGYDQPAVRWLIFINDVSHMDGPHHLLGFVELMQTFWSDFRSGAGLRSNLVSKAEVEHSALLLWP